MLLLLAWLDGERVTYLKTKSLNLEKDMIFQFGKLLPGAGGTNHYTICGLLTAGSATR